MVGWRTDQNITHLQWTRGFFLISCILFIYFHSTEAKKYVGCYKHDPNDWLFRWETPLKTNYTPPDCVTACGNNGFEKAGLMNGYQCYCSNRPLITESPSCNIECITNWAICGGVESLSVFKTLIKAEDRRYIGCWASTKGPVLEELPDSQVATAGLTSCIVNCRNRYEEALPENLVVGFNKTHCICGDKISDHAQTEEVAACEEGCEGHSTLPCTPDLRLFNIYKAECPDGTYGKSCLPCNCHGNEICNKANGSCPGACADGWLPDPVSCSRACVPGTFGSDCSDRCFCADLVACDPVTGHCPTQCMPGYSGSTCSQACDSGTFGLNCSESCNCLNGTDCDPVNGTCPLGLCPPGWSGLNCLTKYLIADPERVNLEDAGSSGSWRAQVAGGGAGGLLIVVVALVVAIVCYIRHRRKHKRQMEAYKLRMQMLREGSSTALLNETPVHSEGQQDTFTKSPSPGGSPGKISVSSSPEKPLRFRMTASEYVQYFQQRQLTSEALAAEFSMLKRGNMYPWKAAASNPNRKMFNRLANNLPFDYNRVILEDYEKDSDYINASYIKDYDGYDNFIATQGPTQETVNNFWNMIWKCDVKYIIMLTKLIESGRNKCIRYWPAIEGVPADYENKLSVKMIFEDHWPDFVIRKFIISQGLGKREVTHYQFTAWPDMGVPRHTMPFIVFMHLVKSHRKTLTGPNIDRTVVHCSTGGGRTGTFLAIDLLGEQLDQEEELDIPTCVQSLREQRVNMVQTLDQYAFVYSTLYDHLTVGQTRTPAEYFPQNYADLRDDYPGVIEKQFQTLEVLENEAKNAGNHNDSGRGSVTDFSTVSETRPISLSSNHSLLLAQYIPVNGYYSKNAFLISRFPGLNEPVEFWSTVHDNNSRIVVSFTTTDCCWPTAKDDKQSYGPFTLTCVGHSVLVSHQTKIHHVVLELSAPQINSKRFIDVYHASIDGPLSYDILQLNCQLQVARDVTRSTAPVAIHNSSNYQVAGVLCTLNVITEMLDIERQVDIFLAVQRVRGSVPFFIESVDMYKQLHEITADFIRRS